MISSSTKTRIITLFVVRSDSRLDTRDSLNSIFSSSKLLLLLLLLSGGLIDEFIDTYGITLDLCFFIFGVVS